MGASLNISQLNTLVNSNMKKTKNVRNEYLNKVSYVVTFNKSDSEVVRYPFRVKSRLLRWYRAQSLVRMESMNVSVKYLRGVENTADFTNITELQEILSLFTEKNLLEFIYKGEW